jgi:hypothetical protein
MILAIYPEFHHAGRSIQKSGRLSYFAVRDKKAVGSSFTQYDNPLFNSVHDLFEHFIQSLTDRP